MTETTTTTQEKPLPAVLDLPNVRISEKFICTAEKLMGLPAAKRTILLTWALATNNPLWEFTFDGMRDVTVRKDGEVLGMIGERWYGTNLSLYVNNDRINGKRQRGSGYHTQDIAKAVARVRKEFSPKTYNERMADAYKLATTVVNSEMREKAYKRRGCDHQLTQARLAYAQSMETQFLLWLKETNNITMLEQKRMYDELTVDMATIQGVMDDFDKRNIALVVLADGKYIVKIRDNVQLYDDVTLPVDLRGKLGMLKLVENEAMVTGIGCRVNDETFVLQIEVNEDAKTET